ncbi:hypothetical protein [Macrococcus carouselicus]|uniref:HNH endonuclease n=1 Tax=Macrococcus carouselicus TaxID=69969 RepID=A0A9Q8CJP5_9STAP|nr:hypothetical protein [Macrococcus carouselicus]TDM04053.1 hypothetical protein ERX40_02470 [Macrococcus carouselicus]
MKNNTEIKSQAQKELEMLVSRNEATIYHRAKMTDIYITMYGAVYSHHRGTGRVKKRALTLHKKSGYYRITIDNKPIEIHRMVAEKFVLNTNPEKFNVVDHISANYAETSEEAFECRKNNDYRNLRWTDATGNMKFAHENGLTDKLVNINRLLTIEQALEVRAKYATGDYTQAELAKEYGVRSNVMSNLLNNKTYQNIG